MKTLKLYEKIVKANSDITFSSGMVFELRKCAIALIKHDMREKAEGNIMKEMNAGILSG